ncbi:hypothetical protein ACOME3_000648 [Neoechinorhynchus agilis]
MHKIALEYDGEKELNNIQLSLSERNIKYKVWIENPENLGTCIALKPYPKKAVYAGQAIQEIEKWISQHKQACRTFDKSTAISNHQQTTQHKVDFEKARFITSEPDLRRRLIFEAIHIRGNPTMEGNKSNFTLELPKFRNMTNKLFGNKQKEDSDPTKRNELIELFKHATSINEMDVPHETAKSINVDSENIGD